MSPIFEFLIALLFVFLLLSTIVSSLVEFYSSRVGRNSRSVLLYEALLKVFNDRHNRNFADDLYRHPLIENSKPDADKLPTYLDAGIVANAVVDVFVRQANPLAIQYSPEGKPHVVEPDMTPELAFGHFTRAVQGLHTSETKKLLQSFLHNSNGLPELKTAIGQWYDAYMDRVTGWYKRKIRQRLFWMSVVVVIALNANLFRISAVLWNDDKLRQPLLEQALLTASDSTWKKSMAQGSIEARKQKADSLYQALKLTGLPLGWISQAPGSSELNWIDRTVHIIRVNWQHYGSLSTLLGWLLMAFAIHLGAPFWFDALGKVVNLRAAGTRPQPMAPATAK